MMNRGPLLFLGCFLALAVSFWGQILVPQLQIGGQVRTAIEGTGEQYPPGRPGLARQGEEVYRANGCVECHTQQVRPDELGTDLTRGWGQRRTVAQDYLGDYPVWLGDLRLGPDLANIGLRQTNEVWHLAHLYSPKRMTPGSTMPPYRYLFEKRILAEGQAPSGDALPMGMAAEPGVEVVPRPEALVLAAYLVSLRSEAPLLEAPLPSAATHTVPAAPAATNQSVATNVVAPAP